MNIGSGLTGKGRDASSTMERGRNREALGLPSDKPDLPVADECCVYDAGGEPRVHLGSRGFTLLINQAFEDVITSNGGQIRLHSDAVSSAGRSGKSCVLQEIAYKYGTELWFAYRMSASDAASWREEVWTTDRRLTASAAAATLDAARQIAFATPQN